MKVNILGTDYTIEERSQRDDVNLLDMDGYLDDTLKLIVMDDGTSIPKDAPGHVKDFDVVAKKILRHELVHAFFFESGLEGYGRDEQLIDWIARQLPKMVKAMTKAGAM